MPKTEKIVFNLKCELCPAEEDNANGFWAEIEFKSEQFLFDEGTHTQNYSWVLCRGCKCKLIRFMQGKKP